MAFIKFLLKTLLNLTLLVFLLLICILGLAIWTAPKIAPKLIDSWIEGKTGFTSTIGKMDITFLSGNLNMENISITNPPYYQNKNFIQIKEFSAKVELKSLWKKPVVFDKVFVDIDRLTWIRNAQGSVNVLEFADNFKNKLHKPKSTLALPNAPDLQNSPPQPKYLIKKLVVQINSVNVVGIPNEDDSQNLPLNYSREFSDITNIEEVMKSISADLTTQGVTLLTQELFNPQLLRDINISQVKHEIAKTVEKLFPDLKKLRKSL